MTRTETVMEANAFQETLDHLQQYSFHNGTTIYWDGGFGRCDTEGVLVGEQLKSKKWGLHYYRTLSKVTTVYCFSLPADDKYKRRRNLCAGQLFRAGGGRRISQK